MEVGPAVLNHELAPQPDLLDIFAEREVTIFGITGTFEELAKMCPVDLSDASITIEAKNEFVVKAANEAGLEIEADYEPIFSKITRQQGLERKFTIATSTPDGTEHQQAASPPIRIDKLARVEPGKAD